MNMIVFDGGLMSVIEAAATGDRRQTLQAIRAKLAFELECASGRDAATVAKQLSDTIRELDALPLPQGESRVDQIAAARDKRRAKAAGSQRSRVRDVGGA